MYSPVFNCSHGFCSYVAVALAQRPERGGLRSPVFLWIIAEDTGPWLGCYGEPLVKTAHLDALAARGIRFTNAWAGGAACSPSRSSFFTGMFAAALGTETHRGDRAVPPRALSQTSAIHAD